MLNKSLIEPGDHRSRQRGEHGRGKQYARISYFYCVAAAVAEYEWPGNTNRPSRDLLKKSIRSNVNGGFYCMPAGESAITTPLREYPA
jgi:hypothetical protein